MVVSQEFFGFQEIPGFPEILVASDLPGCAAPPYVSHRSFNNKAWGPQATSDMTWMIDLKCS